tara:strand:- start:11 stop:112 length:102 start_codon:yes stop_codon:yes gene_type:complete
MGEDRKIITNLSGFIVGIGALVLLLGILAGLIT